MRSALNNIADTYPYRIHISIHIKHKNTSFYTYLLHQIPYRCEWNSLHNIFFIWDSFFLFFLQFSRFWVKRMKMRWDHYFLWRVVKKRINIILFQFGRGTMMVPICLENPSFPSSIQKKKNFECLRFFNKHFRENKFKFLLIFTREEITVALNEQQYPHRLNLINKIRWIPAVPMVNDTIMTKWMYTIFFWRCTFPFECELPRSLCQNNVKYSLW